MNREVANHAIIASTMTTARTSISVKPSWWTRILPAADVFILPRSARLVVGPEREDVERPVLAGRAVVIRTTPWIVRHLALGEVRAVPAGGSLWGGNERLEALTGRRITARI